MDITFTINDQLYKVNANTVSLDTSLNTFIRSHANLPGTKFMCQEGGCGACIVTLKGIHPVTKERETWAVNSCLLPILSCHGLGVVTIEGIGNKRSGYHEAQTHLAHFNGTQCGYCSPGMVMNMYSLLESKNGKVTMEEVENSFGGNICRCTGYRPILDAFKSLAIDADPKLIELCKDIEDLPVKKCPKTGSPCSRSCSVGQRGFHLTFDGNKEWHKVYNVDEIFSIFKSSGNKPYMLIAGNTGHGVYRRSSDIEVFIDISGVEKLRTYSINEDSVELGANLPLTEMMEVLTKAANSHLNFAYCHHLVAHVDLIANVPVRNMGTIAGNLSMKHERIEFPSDIFLILEAVNAKITVREGISNSKTLNLQEYLKENMKNKVLLKVTLPPLKPGQFEFRSYKIMPRAQNAHAYVNAGFLFEFNENRDGIKSARICFGGINPKFIRADKTEKLLVNKNIFNNETISAVCESLNNELEPDWILPDSSPEYRKNLAIGLFYKAILNMSPSGKIQEKHKSGGSLLERPISSGSQTFDTYKDKWPLTQFVPKIEGLVQCSGEATYANDLLTMPNELWGAFVHATKVHSKIIDFNTEEAMKIPGVVAFYSAKDIPGSNNFTSPMMTFMPETEEIFCSGEVLFNGQVAGMIVANSNALAHHAATLVKVVYDANYKSSETVIFPTILDVLAENASSLITDLPTSINAKSYGSESTHTVKGRFEIGSQYHYTMETQTCVSIPTEDGLDVYSSTQWMDLTQIVIANALNIPQNNINLQVRRVGGGYGGKISRSGQIACAASLACHLLNRPVRFVMSLESNMTAVGKRYACVNDYEVEVNSQGKIQKLTNLFWQDYGCTLNEVLSFHSVAFFKNCYNNDSWDVKSKAVKTNAPSHTWCRSPGTTEGIAMIENIMEHIAQATGQDPNEVRMINMAEDSQLKTMMPDFMASIDFAERKKEIDEFNKENRWKKRGIAIVPMKYPQGHFGSLIAFVAIYHGDGTVAITHGGIEMGQGVNTKAAQVAAHVLGIPLKHIVIKPSNNVTAANAIVSGGSQTSEVVAFAVMRACETLRDRIQPIRDEMKDKSWAEVAHACHNKSIDLTASHTYKADELKNYDIWGISCADMEIDLLTGNLQLRRVDILEDTGESMSPSVDVGQVEGAFIMGVGYWLFENLVYNRQDGELLTNRTWTYKPPGAKDIPVDFRLTFLQKSTNPALVLRAKATGEPPLCMSIVVLFALRHALNSARRDAGLDDEWYNMGAPTTTENVFLLAGNNYQQYKL